MGRSGQGVARGAHTAQLRSGDLYAGVGIKTEGTLAVTCWLVLCAGISCSYLKWNLPVQKPTQRMQPFMCFLFSL